MNTGQIALIQLSVVLLGATTFCPKTNATENAVVPGSAANTQTKMVCSRINWLTSLDEAKQTAKKEHKLIVWIHMLGNIDGFT
ncbi:MAG: hypothetical protein Q8T09_24100 [Candidatus Melainabacteria bacterium]|nr:hypothetical protein [Candidatus Melainabacteria bacterium]